VVFPPQYSRYPLPNGCPQDSFRIIDAKSRYNRYGSQQADLDDQTSGSAGAVVPHPVVECPLPHVRTANT